MVIFGGILEVTKELDDMHSFDFRTKKWTSLYEDWSSSPGGLGLQFGRGTSQMLTSPEGSPQVPAFKQSQSSSSNAGVLNMKRLDPKQKNGGVRPGT